MTVDVQFQQSGPPDAPAVLLLGALGTSLAMWAPQIGALADRYRVIAVDLRGHGGSPTPAGPYTVDELAEDVLALMDELEIASGHLVGASFGGVVAQRLAARSPARVGTLSLIGPIPAATTGDRWAAEARMVRASGTAAVEAQLVGRWISAELAAADPGLARNLVEMMRSTSAEGYAGCCDALDAWDGGARDRARIVAPTLIVEASGSLSSGDSSQRSTESTDGIARSRTVALGCGSELVGVELAGRVSALLLEHLSAQARATVAAGMRARRAVLGDQHVDRAVEGTTEFTEPFQDFITRTAWGDIWSRPGLTHHTRRMLTLAILTALGNEHELDMHIRAALRAGVAPDELAEVFLHTAIYAGVPNSNRAFGLGKVAIAELLSEVARQ